MAHIDHFSNKYLKPSIRCFRYSSFALSWTVAFFFFLYTYGCSDGAAFALARSLSSGVSAAETAAVFGNSEPTNTIWLNGRFGSSISLPRLEVPSSSEISFTFVRSPIFFFLGRSSESSD